MDATYLVGTFGLVLITVGWGISFDVVPSWRLSALYGAGSAVLSLYSYLRGDPVFLALNLLASALAFANLYRYLRRRGAGERGAAASPPPPRSA